MEVLSEKLARFRSTHTARRIRYGACDWEYFEGGTAQECILFLHGGMSTGEMYFEYFLELEKTYRVIAPSIPSGVTTIAGAVRGFEEGGHLDIMTRAPEFVHTIGGFWLAFEPLPISRIPLGAVPL